MDLGFRTMELEPLELGLAIMELALKTCNYGIGNWALGLWN